MPPHWEPASDPSQQSVKIEERAARAVEEAERKAKSESEADAAVEEPIPNATPSDIRNAELLERVDPGMWAIDGELHRVPQALSRYATTRSRALAHSAEEEPKPEAEGETEADRDE